MQRNSCISSKRLRAPSDDGGVLIDPPLSKAGTLLRHNASIRHGHAQYDVAGQSLLELSREARRGLVRDALQYTRAYRDVPGPLGENDLPAILLAGHQPQLPHAGVWFKNFVLDALARRHQAVALQLLIDNDTVRSASIAVPAGSVAQPRLESVLLDRPLEELPYEERPIRDIALFSSFARRARATIAPLVGNILVESIWPWAVEAAKSTRSLGQSLAQSRHRLEESWGLCTLELPLSRVCDSPPFLRFALHLLQQMQHMHDIYNRSLDEYRRSHRIRSRLHPVPDLASAHGWLETPFWLWTSGDPVRRPLWAAMSDREIQLRAGDPRTSSQGERQLGRLSIGKGEQMAMEQLHELRRQGTKLRPRALITTMYARLVLGDLFIHGIGGAKYDQLTNLLMERFFQLTAPEFLTVSATFRLPIPREHVAPEDLRRAQWQLRDLWHHPERHLDGILDANAEGEEPFQLSAEKRRWIDAQPPRGRRRQRHEAIERLNASLRAFVEGQRTQLVHQCDRLKVSLRNEAILGSREYAFCLFPEYALRRPLRELAQAT